MPRRREGPTKSKASGVYFFDEYVGFPPDKKRKDLPPNQGSFEGPVALGTGI